MTSRSQQNGASPGPWHYTRLGLYQLPVIATTAVSHSLRLAHSSPYMDLKPAVTFAVLRNVLNSKPIDSNRTMTSAQRASMRHLPTKGRIWIGKYIAPAPVETNDLKSALSRAIASQNHPGLPTPEVPMPDVRPVYAEWTGYRSGANPNTPLPNMSGKQVYEEMMKEVRSPTTTLYLHGGGYSYMDPGTHRSTVKKIARETGGRAFSIRYRLAPEHPFPAALVDALVAYLTLLYPPPGSYHDPVKPEHIVIAGDSAGGNLSLVLIQAIVDMNRASETFPWHGTSVSIPVPAGVATNSPWLDISHSSAPYYGSRPATFDYLEALDSLGRDRLSPCAQWPANPPRKFLYATDDLISHPYVSPVTRRSWAGFPPMYICTGWERLAYEDKFLAAKLWRDGVKITFEEYEAMPHCFVLIVTTPEAKRCMQGWAGFISKVVQTPASLKSTAVTVSARTLEERPWAFLDISDASEDEVLQRIVDKVAGTKIVASLSKL